MRLSFTTLVFACSMLGVVPMSVAGAQGTIAIDSGESLPVMSQLYLELTLTKAQWDSIDAVDARYEPAMDSAWRAINGGRRTRATYEKFLALRIKIREEKRKFMKESQLKIFDRNAKSLAEQDRGIAEGTMKAVGIR